MDQALEDAIGSRALSSSEQKTRSIIDVKDKSRTPSQTHTHQNFDNQNAAAITPSTAGHGQNEPRGIYNLPPKFETLQKSESVVEVFNLTKGIY